MSPLVVRKVTQDSRAWPELHSHLSLCFSSKVWPPTCPLKIKMALGMTLTTFPVQGQVRLPPGDDQTVLCV